ncbi:hypothetical protein N7G274_002184 [Stereocaulon virgatum]|uniref:Myb-like domain-containing protein n=1 Tax=Stereocaulon virgatum TaxID=373712 RepID=A0ABR4AKY2_9LECA
MVKSRAARLPVNAMGQTSSQPTPAELPQMERTVKSKDKKRKSRTGKRQSEAEQHPIDQEEESARALLLMREGPVHDSRAPYYQDDLATSQQLIAESSPTRPLELANGDESAVISSQKSSTHKSRKSKKKRRSDPFTLFGSEGKGDEMQYPHLPSTPPNQVVHSSPPPYRPSISQSTHALDEISTDDEAVASYLQEYEKDNGNAHLAATLEDNTYGISQQPPHVSDGEGYGIAEHSTYDLAHKASAKQKKRKRDRASTSDYVDDQRQPLENVEGQHILQPDLGTFDQLFEEDRWANTYGHYQENMPIDPELHSMSALPPSVDLSQLGNGVDNAGQKKKQKTKQNGLAPSSKRRRIEEASTAPNHRVPYYSPYALDHLQDRVLPDFEDSRRETSAELGSPYMEDIANKGLEYLSDTANPGPSAQREKKVSSSKASVSKKPTGDKEPKTSHKTISKSGGQWTAAEAEKLDNFRDSYCDANNISKEKFNTHIQSTIRNNVEAKALFSMSFTRSSLTVREYLYKNSADVVTIISLHVGYGQQRRTRC